MRFLDPRNDLTFKKVFGEHPHLLRSFLNALLPLEQDEQIVELDYLPAELVPHIPEGRNSIVDVRCMDEKGRQFIVEMQMLWTDSFTSRVLFNASKAYVKQLRVGEEFKYLQPVYSLNLVDETFIKHTEAWYHHYAVVSVADTEQRIEGLEFVFVELPKFRPQTFPEKKLQVLWLRYLTEIGEATRAIPKELSENVEINETIEYLRESAFDDKELTAYEKYWDGVRVERTLIAAAHEEGKAEGLKEACARLVSSGMPEPEAKRMLGL